jgi:hypothetical protein
MTLPGAFFAQSIIFQTRAGAIFSATRKNAACAIASAMGTATRPGILELLRG